MNILITICARGGSKGIPGKNIRPLNGKPLIAYTIETAFRFARIFPTDVALSTDSDEIKAAAQEYGLASNYMRPNALATDEAGKIAAIRDVKEFFEKEKNKRYDYIIDLDVTSPLRTVEDLAAAFEQLRSNEQALNIFSVSPANRNPYFNMLEQKPDGFYALVKQGDFKTRQSAPPVYDMNASFIVFRDRFFDNTIPSVNDGTLAYVVPHICFDLDHPIDFSVMEILLRENLLDFKL